MQDVSRSWWIVATSALSLATAALWWFTRKSSSKSPRVALNPEKFQSFKLIEKESLSHDTRRFRFALQSPSHVLGLPIGQHMYLRASIDGKDVQRAYTPITSDDEVGYFDLVVKVYFKNVHPKFPEGGKMSQYLESLKIGDGIDIRGPSGRFEYRGGGKYKIGGLSGAKHGIARHIGLVAGGTGITPMMQIVRAVMKDAKDRTRLYLLFANQTEEDILLRQEIEDYGKRYPDRFTFHYTLDRPGPGWKYAQGFVSEEMIKNYLPPATPDTVILMCGPPPMIQYACKPNLIKLNFTEEQCFAF